MVSVVPASHGGGPNSTNGSSRASPALSSTNAASSSTNGSKPKPPVNANGYHPTNPQLPLSSMRSAPLDLRSVERRGQPTASKEQIKRNRPYGLSEAPTYRPTEEEWKDPFEYIRKITPEAREYGLCKVIPPDTWNPEFAIDTEVSYTDDRAPASHLSYTIPSSIIAIAMAGQAKTWPSMRLIFLFMLTDV